MEQEDDSIESFEEKWAARTAQFFRQWEADKAINQRNSRLDRKPSAPRSLLYECPGCRRLSSWEHRAVCRAIDRFPISPDTAEEKYRAKWGSELPEYDFHWYNDQGLEDPY
jgi:hypothetical protein